MKLKSPFFPSKGKELDFCIITSVQIFGCIVCILKNYRIKLPEFLEEKSAVCFLPRPCLCATIPCIIDYFLQVLI